MLEYSKWNSRLWDQYLMKLKIKNNQYKLMILMIR